MSTHRLNGPVLYELLDHKRRLRGLSWRAVGRQLGVLSRSVLPALRHGRGGMHSDALVSALVWLDLDREIAHLIERTDTRTGRDSGPAGLRAEQQDAGHEQLVEQLCTIRPGLRPEQAHAVLQGLATLRWELRRPEQAPSVCAHRTTGLSGLPLRCVLGPGHGPWHDNGRGTQWQAIDGSRPAVTDAGRRTGGE